MRSEPNPFVEEEQGRADLPSTSEKAMTHRTPPIALTIAGSDSGGGAGIQADLKTFHAFGVFGTSAITAITAQNTLGVSAVHPVPVETVQAQIDAVAQDLPPTGVKTGMLATSTLVEAVAESLDRHQLPGYVLDPVMVSSTGARLLAKEAEGAVARHLVPRATLVTPNLHEASILTGMSVASEADQKEAARALVAMGAKAALVKGGHGTGDTVFDFLWDGNEAREWRRPRIQTRHTHGTGCTLSAAIAAGLASGQPLATAVERGLSFVARAIATAPGLGKGHGPLDFFTPAGE